MGTHRMSSVLKHVAAAAVFAAWASSVAFAQTPRAASSLESVLKPGMTVWIVDAGGHEEKIEIADVSGGTVSARVGTGLRQRVAADIMRVRTRRSDSLIDGALIGAGAAIASGLFLCTRTEPWRNCRDDAGPIVRIGAVGAGIGIAVDALIRGRKTIYERDPRSTRLLVTPVVSGHSKGAQISLHF